MKNADQLSDRLADRRTFTKEDRTEFKKWLLLRGAPPRHPRQPPQRPTHPRPRGLIP